MKRGTEFARFADKREAQAAYPDEIYDLTAQGNGPSGAYTIDYVADTGDGFDATYAVAASVNGLCGREPAALLVLGGDEVYPVASVANYDDRLTFPFDETLPDAEEGRVAPIPDTFVVAIPGNHDWYDGLVAFRRNFCESWIDDPGPEPDDVADGLRPVEPAAWRDALLGRQLIQSRSYFSIKLPHGWWLWGLDIQLDAHIDAAQLAYFTRAVALVGEDERVILCTARPSWTDPATPADEYVTTNRANLIWFLDRMFGNDEDPDRADRRHQVPLMISGDKHHYAHYERESSDAASSPAHLITCGGGGAYLSSTHHLDRTLDLNWKSGSTSRYRLREPFPSMPESERLRSQWKSIPLRNGMWLPIMLAGVHAVLCTLLIVSCRTHDPLAIAACVLVALSVVGALIALSAMFAPPRLRRPRTGVRKAAPGALHAIAHLGLASGLATGLILIWTSMSGGGRFILSAVAVAAHLPLAIWGFALYLRLADTIGFNQNELFSAMQIPDFKSHVRLTIGPPSDGRSFGSLTIEVIGIRSVNRLGPDGPLEPSETELIETFHC